MNDRSAVQHAPHLHDWTREQWIAHADRMLAGARRWATPDFARIELPGTPGGYGADVDGLEGFARTFLLAGFRIAGARGVGVDDLIADYSRGIVAGVDPDSPNRWVRIEAHAQAKVEAASLALVLDLTRPWIWERLDGTTQQRVIDYLAPVVGDDTYPQTNWVWFRIVVQTFLRSVGGPWSATDIADDLARHDSFVREDGWMSDGDERAYDHYVGWALQLYPVLWSRMRGADALAGGRTASDIARLDRFLQDALALVGADGAPLIQGRSLVYRFAAAAPFWAGVLADVPSIPLGRLRVAAASVVAHFAEHGAPDDDDLLSLGWFGPWRRLAQNYSGTGSPYWASKGMLGIMLPEDHPVWAAPAVPLPVTEGDLLRCVSAAGWIVSATADDGIVRVVNHGTDHALEGTTAGDSPLYARMGYSTATSPLLNGDGWAEPLEQSVALVDERGRATHRAGMRLLTAQVRGGVGIAASTAHVRWIEPAAVQVRHGSGITGAVQPAGRITTWSLVRGAWEVRIARVDALEPGAPARALRFGGWAMSGPHADTRAAGAAAVARIGDIESAVHALTPGGSAAIERREQASPLGAVSFVPVVSFAVSTGEPAAVAIALRGGGSGPPPALDLDGDGYVVTWPDGVRTAHHHSDLRTATPTDR